MGNKISNQKNIIDQSSNNTITTNTKHNPQNKNYKTNMPNKREIINEHIDMMEKYLSLIEDKLSSIPCTLDFLKEGVIFIRHNAIYMSDNMNYELKDNECWKKNYYIDFQTGGTKTDYQLYQIIKLDSELLKKTRLDLYKNFHTIIEDILKKINGTNICDFKVYNNCTETIKYFSDWSQEYNKVLDKITVLKKL